MILALFACLPKEAIGRREDLEADRYRLEVSVATVTEGPAEVAPFTWRLEGDVLASWTRSFRDGSIGRLVRLEGITAKVERDGVASPAPAGLDGAFFELRAFPEGEVLKVGPLAPWAGGTAHVEVLDLLWPALSPAIPPLDPGESAPKTTSWPTALGSVAPVRNRLDTTWSLAGKGAGEATLRYVGRQTVGILGEGDVEGEVELDTRTPRLLSHALTARRAVRTQWPAGSVLQRQDLRLSLRFVGTAPAPHAVAPAVADSPIADAAPLELSDGRAFPPAPEDALSRLPFVLLPDDLDEAARGAIRARLLDAGRVSPQETVP
ncbi:MAG: hypothetical protein ACOZNI_00465 [Myxococcota bacterium]